MNSSKQINFAVVTLTALLVPAVVSLEVMAPDQSTLAFRLEALLSVCLSFLIYRYVWAHSGGYLLPRLCGLIYQIQTVIILVLSVLAPEASITNMQHFFRLADYAPTALSGLVLMQVGPVFVTWLLGIGRNDGMKDVAPLRDRVRGTEDRFALFLGFAACIRLLSVVDGLGWLESAGFFVRVLQAMLIIAPFFVPLLPPKYRKIKLFWMAVMVVTGIYGLLTGGRFTPLLPFVLYGFGMVLGMNPGPKRRILLGFGAVMTIPFIIFINLLGDLRSEYGRIDYDQVDTQRLSSYVTNIGEVDNQSQADRSSLHRLVNWPNLVIPALTPEVVAYRGTDNLGRELARFFDIGFISGTSRRDVISQGLATAPAKRYGFRVNTRTSVPYGVLPDGWARAGPLGALLYSIILALILVGAEAWFVRSKLFSGDIALIFVMPLMRAALFTTRSDPLYTVVRHVALDIIMLSGVLAILQLAYSTMSLRHK